MKLTGIIILMIGVVMGVFTLGQYLLASGSQSPEAPNAAALPMMQFLFAGIAAVTGGLLMVYGGSGLIRSRNPAIRN